MKCLSPLLPWPQSKYRYHENIDEISRLHDDFGGRRRRGERRAGEKRRGLGGGVAIEHTLIVAYDV